MVDPVVAIRTLLLREALPEVALRPGASVVARVASRGEGHGVLVLAGVPLTATLPDEVRAGETLRLRVDDVTPERVTLRLEGAPQPAPAAGPPPGPRPEARVAVQDPPRRARRDGEDVATVALTFTSAVLGRLDLRIELAASHAHVIVGARAGDPYDRAVHEAERLRATLAERTGREASVRVRPRHDPVDVYA
jgi:hypothetical protein